MKDLILAQNGDLLIQNGDLVIGDCDDQNLQLLLMLPKGSLKEFPTATVGLMNYLESEDPAELFREIRLRLEQDGRVVNKIGFNSEGRLEIDAPYK
jgi:hypothetical protein